MNIKNHHPIDMSKLVSSIVELTELAKEGFSISVYPTSAALFVTDRGSETAANISFAYGAAGTTQRIEGMFNTVLQPLRDRERAEKDKAQSMYDFAVKQLAELNNIKGDLLSKIEHADKQRENCMDEMAKQLKAGAKSRYSNTGGFMDGGLHKGGLTSSDMVTGCLSMEAAENKVKKQ